MKPEHDPTSLGNLAKIFHGITQPTLDLALRMKKEKGWPLGTCLLAQGALDENELKALVEKQKCLRGQNPCRKDVSRVVDYVSDVCNCWSSPLRVQPL